MTPTARRVMEKVREMQPATDEQWVQMMVDAALDEAASKCREQIPQDADEFTNGYRLACDENAENILALKSPEKESCA